MILRFTVLVVLLLSFTGCIPRGPCAFYCGRQNFLSQNYKAAKEQLLGPAEEGNPEAQYAIGYLYLNGLGTPLDDKQGRAWIERSAKQGYPPAQYALEILGPPPIEAEDEYGEYMLKIIPKPTYCKR